MASGTGAHAEGYQTSAWGDYSHASGWGTKATGKAQMVVGKYNLPSSNALFIVGDGISDSNRKNAFETGYDPDGYYYAKIGNKYYTDQERYLITASIYLENSWCYYFSFETTKKLETGSLSKSECLEYFQQAMEVTKVYPCSGVGTIRLDYLGTSFSFGNA